MPCYALCFVSLLAILISAFFILSISIERNRVVKYPLNARERSSKKIEVVFSIIFAILISLVMSIRYKVEGLSHSPLLLGKSEDSVTQNIVTVIKTLGVLPIYAMINPILFNWSKI